MATPTWPVPYYQRVYRHDPQPLHHNGMNLEHHSVPIHDFHSMTAKEILKNEGKGYVVEAVENHFDIQDYQTRFTDSGIFSEAYVDDMIDCLDLVARQN